MPDFNNVFLVGTKTPSGDGWIIDQATFSCRAEAEKEAEARTVKGGLEHHVFKSVSYYTRDEITASKTHYA
ncbi:MAG: hypothetical protein IMZ54_07750 [Acidobacteria bacterium]|nr:hypothetical protein [Acidobacteriota bacterium]